MSAIIYIAANRAPLKTGHTVGTEYSIDLKLKAFSENFDFSKTAKVALNGNVATTLKRSSRVYSVGFSWENSKNADVEEFLFSVAGGEIFTFDPYGTVAVPDNPVSCVMLNNGVSVQRMTRGTTPHRTCTLTFRPVVLD